MIAKLLALAVAAFLAVPAPGALNAPERIIADAVPEPRVLAAAAVAAEDAPQRRADTIAPDVSAGSYVVLDVASGALLAAKDPSKVRSVASLTKLLTALTVMHAVENLDAYVTVSANASRARIAGADMDLRVGETLAVRDLLAGLLIPSANDAAVALAEHVAGSEAAFAQLMNARANDFGLARTHAENATGLDAQKHFSSAMDMATVLLRAWQDPLLGVFLRAESLTVTSLQGRAHPLRTTNRLLGERSDVLAGKTGFTTGAGESLAVVAEGDDGHPIVAVLLDSQDRFGDMNTIINWTFWAHTWSDHPAEVEEAP